MADEGKRQVYVLNIGKTTVRLRVYGLSTLLKTFRIHRYREMFKHRLIPANISTDVSGWMITPESNVAVTCREWCLLSSSSRAGLTPYD